MLQTIPTFAAEICRQVDAVAGEGERNSVEKGGGACLFCVRKKHAVLDCQGI